MGNREDLLAGALACLKTKGWTRTTVRDIAAAAGVNHAAIGYHFGSREALLIEAFTQAMDEWGTETEAAVRAASAAGAGPREQYEAFWHQVIASYAANRWLWLATIEAAVQAEHSPKVRELLAASLRQGRSGLAAGLLGVAEDALDGPAMPPPEMSTDLVMAPPVCRPGCVVVINPQRHRRRFYPSGQSNWIIQLVDRAAMIGAMSDRRGERRRG